ncbi:hypothetical protein GPECTOR_36g19 [Gonium pectorale]|uniref:Inner centromere protein ARK-binding domain-containing protein n=1 Tax=Gonium pectorale TaxID=33097 RepID=A0A150GBT2_GONPE|nr:hypothetical protein GPECTOR_36g19 [Gonium pectorale]|eukprot:KXZ47292.1 hypothetical protein GPECTOR_36g19 [Gonium pectorale]
MEEIAAAAKAEVQGLVAQAAQRVYQLRNRNVIASTSDGTRRKKGNKAEPESSEGQQGEAAAAASEQPQQQVGTTAAADEAAPAEPPQGVAEAGPPSVEQPEDNANERAASQEGEEQPEAGPNDAGGLSKLPCTEGRSPSLGGFCFGTQPKEHESPTIHHFGAPADQGSDPDSDKAYPLAAEPFEEAGAYASAPSTAATMPGSVKAKAAFFQAKEEQAKRTAVDLSVARKAAPGAPVASSLAAGMLSYKAGAQARDALAAGDDTAAVAAVATAVAAAAGAALPNAAAASGVPRLPPTAPAAPPAETLADKHKRVEAKRKEEEERRRAELEARTRAKDDKLRNFEAAKQMQRQGTCAGALRPPAAVGANPLAVHPPGKRPPLNGGGAGAGDLTEEEKRNVHAIQTSPYIMQVKPRTPGANTASKPQLTSYEISPYRSDTEDDEDDSPHRARKPLPEWAAPAKVLEALRAQHTINADAIFGACPKTIDIIKVFSDMPPPGKTDMRGRPRRDYRRRGSSGCWDADDF